MKDKKLLFLVAIVLVIISLTGFLWEIISGRWLRLLTSVVFLFVAMKIVGFKNLLGFSIFGALVLCDFLLLKWDAMFAKHAYYPLHILIVLALLFLTLRKMKWKEVTLFEIIPAFLFFVVNLWILWTLKEFFHIEDILLEILFLMNGIITILLIAFVFILSLSNFNNSSSFFFLGVLGFVVSELMMEFEMLRYVDNFFYILGLFFLLRTTLENKGLKKANLNQLKEEEVSKSEGLITYH